MIRAAWFVPGWRPPAVGDGRTEFHAVRVAPRRNTPCGFTLVELVVTTVILAVMAATIAPLLMHAGRHQRETDRRQLALLEVQNVLERIAARPWSELTPEAAAQEPLPETCRRYLPGAWLAVRIDAPDEDGAKRIAVELAWKLRNGVEAAPVRLVTWRYSVPTEDR